MKDATPSRRLKRRRKLTTTRVKRQKGATLQRLRAQFESNRLAGPYFPLARFGGYFVTARDASGKVVSFSRFEKIKDQGKFAAQMEAQGYKVEKGIAEHKSEFGGAVDPAFVADVDSILEAAQVPEPVRDSVWQTYLKTLPDLFDALALDPSEKPRGL